MYTKIGLEKEFFIVDEENNPQLVPVGIPKDECGWLVEARGLPFDDPYSAVFSLMAEEEKLREMVTKKTEGKLKMVDVPVMKIDKALRIAAGRINIKGLIQYQNLYGYIDHSTKSNESTAGVHISLTHPKTITKYAGEKSNEPVTFEYNANFDWPFVFAGLDEDFKDEIKSSRRKPGFYEIKLDGRVEYRSLPANVDLKKVITSLNDLLRL